MKKVFLLLILFCGQLAYSQSIEGVLFDKTTQTPIVFANVLTTQNRGVISNVEGAFKINAENLKNSDSLIVLSLGYELKSVSVTNFKTGDTLFMKLQQQMLDEVVVSAEKYSAEEIIEKFKDSVEARHSVSPAKFQIFARNKSTNEPVKNGIELDKSSFMSKSNRKQFNEKVEAYFNKIQGKVSSSYTDMLYNTYYLKDSTAVEQIKNTYLVNDETDNSMDNIQRNVFKELIDALDTQSTFKVRTGIIPIEDSLSTDEFIVKDEQEKRDTIKNSYSKRPVTIISKAQSLSSLEIFEDSKKYEFKIEDTSFFNGSFVYIISFKPGRGSAKYKGKAYINAEDFGLLKLEYELIEGKKEAGVNLKFLLGIKFRVDNSRYQYIFKRNEDKSYVPLFYKSSENQYVYFDRSFIFKENEYNRDERIKFKVSLYVESNSLRESEYLIINRENIDPKNIEFDPDAYIFQDKIDRYDPEIWKDYNILQATEEIKNYK